MNVFDVINSINNKTKEDLNDVKLNYNSWIINKSFSFGLDTIYWANEMNKYHNLDKDMQYAFLYGSINKSKRYNKWEKADSHKELDIIKEAYNVSNRKASSYLDLLNDEQRNKISEILFKGGT
jgi:hypothetical protein